VKEYLNKCKARKTRVVAKLTTVTGEIFYGVNIESSCHTLSICGERAAIVHAVTALGPNMVIASIEVYAEKDGVPINILPCGGCRQLTVEFSDENTILIDRKISDWLPNPYK